MMNDKHNKGGLKMGGKEKRKGGILMLPNGKAHARVWNGDQKIEKTFDTKTAAKEWVTAEKAAIHRGESAIGSAKVSISDLIAAWLPNREVVAKATHPNDSDAQIADRVGRYKRSLETMAGMLGASFPITDIHRSHGEDYKNLRRGQNIAPITINRELTALGQVFEWA